MSRSEKLILPRQFLDAMLQHARTELPNECCGVLAGVMDADVLHVKAWYPLANEAASPTEYHAAKDMFQAVKKMRADGHDIVAIYHSHPTTAPIPSRKDLERNFYGDDVVHFIIGLQEPEPLVRGWWLMETEFAEANWQIIEA